MLSLAGKKMLKINKFLKKQLNYKVHLLKIFFLVKVSISKIIPNIVSPTNIGLKDEIVYDFLRVEFNDGTKLLTIENEISSIDVVGRSDCLIYPNKSVLVIKNKIYPEFYDPYHFKKGNGTLDSQYIANIFKPKFLYLNNVYLISTEGSDNYYHFIYDLLPKFLVIKSSLHNNDSVIVGKKVIQIGREILTSLEPRCNFVFSHKNIIRPKRLSIPYYETQRSSNPDLFTLDLLRVEFKNLVSSNSNLRQDYYLFRGKRQGRNITNEHLFAYFLADKGFLVLDLENKSFTEQLNIFFNARSIISIHGAGLTNIFICEKSTRIIEIFPLGFNGDFFQSISNRLDLNFKRYSIKPNNASYDITVSQNDYSNIMRLLDA